MRIVLVTGTRDDDYFDRSSVQSTLMEIKPDLVVHGDCPTGVDSIIKAQCHHAGIPQIPMPAQWDQFGKRGGFLRNEDMASTVKMFGHYGHELICLGFPKGTEWSGTRHCMSRAEHYGFQVFNCGDE